MLSLKTYEKMTSKSFPFLSISFAVLLGSCVKNLNTDPDTTVVIDSEWAFPLAKSRLDLQNLINNNDLITSDPDGLVRLVYRQDSIFSQSVSDYTRIPDQMDIKANVTVGNPAINVDQNLGTFGGAKFKSIGLKTGLLRWEAENPSAQSIVMQLTFKNTTVGGQPASFSFSTTPGQSQGTINLNDLTIDLTQGNPAYNNLGLEFFVSNSNGAPNGTEVNLNISLTDLVVQDAIGFFGIHSVALPSGRIDTKLGIISNIVEGFYLSNPSVKLITTSNIGLPLTINSEIIGVSRQGKIEGLALAPFTFQGANMPGNVYQYDFVINPSTSNIANFISNIPNEIIYSGTVQLNPAGDVGNDNFAGNNGYLTIGMEAELPLELSTNNLVLEQTFYNLNLSIDAEDSESVESLTMGFKIENGFPLDADLQVLMIDSTGNQIDSLFIALFDAAQVNSSGNVVSPAKTIRYLDFNRQNIDNLLATKTLRVKVVLNTTNAGVVRILSDYYLDLTIGTRIKLNYTVK